MNRHALLKEISDRRHELRKLELQLHADSKHAFQAEIADFFDAHPIVAQLRFTQCTPYFNDGDVCTFRSGDPELSDVVDDAHWPDETLYFENHDVPYPKWNDLNYSVLRAARYRTEPNPSYTPAHAAAVNAIEEIWRQYETDQWEGMYGDHVEVTFTRSGTRIGGELIPDVESYTEHD